MLDPQEHLPDGNQEEQERVSVFAVCAIGEIMPTTHTQELQSVLRGHETELLSGGAGGPLPPPFLGGATNN